MLKSELNIETEKEKILSGHFATSYDVANSVQKCDYFHAANDTLTVRYFGLNFCSNVSDISSFRLV